jgi:small multidrug resistance pump
MAYFYLAMAIVAEVVATSALKASDQFSKPAPSAIVIVGYGIAFYLLSHVLKSIPVGVAYAVWSGMGIVLIAIVGAVVFDQIPDPPAIIGMILILCGIVVVNVGSKTLGH